jgi:hypothetical protein
VSADPPKTVRGGGPRGSAQALRWTLLLGAVVVLVAAMEPVTHFSGPRFAPHFGLPKSHRQKVKPPPSRPMKEPVSKGSFPWWIVGVILGVILLAVITYVLWWLWTNRRSRSREREAPPWEKDLQVSTHALEPEPDVPLLRSGIEQALDALDDGREPADAIVRAWLGLQETAEESGILRGPAETPTEFTTRIMKGAFADDRAVRTLLRLYLRTRFGNHPVTDADVAEVRVALEELIAGWPAPATTSAPAAAPAPATPAPPRPGL